MTENTQVDPSELERLRAENEELKKQIEDPAPLRMKISNKGALSVYGMYRFPTTLYKEQWLRLLDHADEIRQFIRNNDSKLRTNDERK